MIKISPVSEEEAKGEIREIYRSIKIILELSSVPLIFKYMAAFPYYLSYIWQQTIKNLNSQFYRECTDDIAEFAQKAVDDIYHPSNLALLFMNEVKDTKPKEQLVDFSLKNLRTSSKLYFLALSIRESIKGKYLGLKQFGEKVTEEEKKIFYDFTDGFVSEIKEKPEGEEGSHLSKQSSQIETLQYKQQAIVKSLTEHFFKIIDHEMKLLTKREAYLTRRVELERFSLNKLYLLPFPLDSSLTTMVAKGYNNPHFPELIYLVSELFPTESPYKLMASSVMKSLLNSGESTMEVNEAIK